MGNFLQTQLRSETTVFVTTMLDNTCAKTHQYSKVKRPFLRVLTFTMTVYAINVQIRIFFDGS